MGQIDSGSKSSRLLASRRYTHNTLTTAQESFTNVFDLQASEVYTQASKIPSSGLPFSSSADNGSNYTVGSDNILKYWYRQKLTKSNVNNEVWFFLDPSGSNDGVGAQLIHDNQEVNFVSPKYSVASLATSTTEDTTPGYLAVLYKSTSATSGSLTSDDIVSTNDYQFDYKTGIVQFMNANVDPSDSQYIFMTVNQYVGKTLATGVEVSGNISGSVSSTGSFGRLEIAGDGDITGNLTLGGNIILGDADTDYVSFGADISSSLIPDVSDSYNLGSDTKRWNDLYLSGSISASGGPIDIDSATTVAIDSSGAISFDAGATSNLTTSAGDIDINAAANLDLDGATIDIDSAGALSLQGGAASDLTTGAGAITVDGKTGVDIKEDGTSVITIDTNQDTLFASTGGSTSDPDVEFDGYTRFDGVAEITLATDSTSTTTGALIVDGGVGIAKNLVVGGSVTAQEFHAQFVSASILYKSGSTKFGDTQDDTHHFTGSLLVTGSLALNSYTVTEFSNDTSLADSSANALVTEYAVKNYVDDNSTDQQTYLRKQYFKTTTAITVPATASFTAVTASAPSGMTGTTKNDFIFFINGQYMEHDALAVQQSGSYFYLKVNNDSIG